MGARLDGPDFPEILPLVEQIKSGHPVFVATGDVPLAGPDARRATASRLAVLAARMLTESQPDLIAVTGGDTAVAFLRAVSAKRLELSGAPASGLALGEAVVDSTRRLPLLTKAGGFGPPDLFLSLLEGSRP